MTSEQFWEEEFGSKNESHDFAGRLVRKVEECIVKKPLILSICGILALAFCVLSCNMDMDNNPLIGYWRSENTYQSTSSSTVYNMYDVYIFEQNKVLHYGTSSLSYIKQANYHSEHYADLWRSYTIDNNRIIIEYGMVGGYSYNEIIPFYFSGANLILTISLSDAKSKGLSSSLVKYVRIE